MAGLSRVASTFGVSPRVGFLYVNQCSNRRLTLSSTSSVDNEDHCDFRKLRSLLIRAHMLDLVSTTEDAHYEAYRQAQMETRKFGEAKVKKLDNPKFKEEEELLRKRFTEQVKMEEARFRQWEQHVSFTFLHTRREHGDSNASIGCLSSSPRGTGSTRTSRPPTVR